MNKKLITSALPYANGYLHLGHCAGAYLPADIYARFLRLAGEEVLYVCGSDEHGVAINISADKEKLTPKDIIDKYHYANLEAFNKFAMSFDIYSRTSLEEHHSTAREFFADFLKKGLLIEKEEEQFYDIKAEMFLPDRYVEGICPNCGYDKARGDQCDSCGAYYNQTELKNPISTVTQETPIVKKTTHWYMKFQEFQTFLEKYISDNSKLWKDNVIQQSKSWLKAGLAERAITRDLSWGVKIKGIEGIDDAKAEGKALYVWFDAVLGYISATKIWAGQNNADWQSWWKSQDTDYYAFIGKDNIVFHTLIFPAMLNARGGYLLPKNVPANEFLNLEGQKFSKSRNWSIDLKDFVEDFPQANYIDALRYTLTMNAPETRDSDFTWKDLQNRNNNELAAILGNFINRTLQFLGKNFDSKVPHLSAEYANFESLWNEFISKVDINSPNTELISSYLDKLSQNDIDLLISLKKSNLKSVEFLNRFRFRDAVSEIMNTARAANKYFNDEEPWKSLKANPEKAAKTMFVAVQLVRTLAVMFSPVLPLTCEKVFRLLNEEPITGTKLNLGTNLWIDAIHPKLEQGRELNKPDILFVQIDDEVIKLQQDKLGLKDINSDTPAEPVNLITIDDFKNVKLKTAKIISAEKLKKSKKLLKIQVDLGTEKRQIIAGIAEHYTAEQIIGKTVVVVANLTPAKLMGEESQGMLLAANSADGKLSLVTIENADLDLGSEVR